MEDNYTGDVYIAVVGPETEFGVARDSIHNIRRRQGDSGPHFVRATKGFEARQMHLNSFIQGKHDFILFLDHDMTFPPDTLERLRSHGKPYVSGLYMRRRYDPIAPIWFEDNPAGEWPFQPYSRDPERGRLHKIGASGWGCILVHREVILAVRELLNGEEEIIEDDMDVWPYDLQRVLRVIRLLGKLPTNWQIGERDLRRYVHKCATVLQQEIRPLRGKKDNVGSDIRFPFFAKAAGYQLYGDPDVRCGHILFYPLTPDDYSALTDEQRNAMHRGIAGKVEDAREQWHERIAALRGQA